MMMMTGCFIIVETSHVISIDFIIFLFSDYYREIYHFDIFNQIDQNKPLDDGGIFFVKIKLQN